MVARELPRVVDPRKVVPKVAPMATREGADSRVDARGDRGGRTSFFSY